MDRIEFLKKLGITGVGAAAAVCFSHPITSMAAVNDDLDIKQNKYLSNKVNVAGAEYATVETAVGALANYSNAPVLPVNPSVTPTKNGSIWITT